MPPIRASGTTNTNPSPATTTALNCTFCFMNDPPDVRAPPGRGGAPVHRAMRSTLQCKVSAHGGRHVKRDVPGVPEADREELDELPEQAFYMRRPIEEAIGNAEKMAAGV